MMLEFQKIISWASVSDFEKRLPSEKIDLGKREE